MVACADTTHINGTPFANSASTWYFDIVTKALASLCKGVDSPEPLLPAHEILILVAFSSDYMAYASLLKFAGSPVFAAVVYCATISSHILHWLELRGMDGRWIDGNSRFL